MKRLADNPMRVDRRMRQTGRYWQRRANGLCPTCGKAVERFVYCQPCREHKAAWYDTKKSRRGGKAA